MVHEGGLGEGPVDYIPEATTGTTPSEGGVSLALPGLGMGIAHHPPTSTTLPHHHHHHVSRERKEVIQEVFGMNGQEVVAWYTCYGNRTFLILTFLILSCTLSYIH